MKIFGMKINSQYVKCKQYYDAKNYTMFFSGYIHHFTYVKLKINKMDKLNVLQRLFLQRVFLWWVNAHTESFPGCSSVYNEQNIYIGK